MTMPHKDGIAPFDRRQLRQRRDRAAVGFADHDFLARHAAEGLAERLGDIKRCFPLTVALGGGGCLIDALEGRFGIERLIHCDLSRAMLRRQCRQNQVVADEEWLPFADTRLDLIVSVLGLHWVNDLPGALIQIRRALKPDGLFLAAIPGGESLTELRQALMRAEADVEGGASPRVAPFIDIRDAGALLQRAGFALPVVDTDTLTATYPDALALMRELRGMGESNVMLDRRRKLTRRATLMSAVAIYMEMFSSTNGRVPATFEFLYLTGWAPHESQQKPMKPGQGKTSLATALGSSSDSEG